MNTTPSLISGDQRFGIGDLRLAELAARELWPIRESLRADALERLATIITDPARSAREVTAAVRALATFSKINLQTITQMVKADEQESGRPRRTVWKSAIGDRPSFDSRPSSDTIAPASADCPEPSAFSDPSSVIGHSPSAISPEPTSVCPVPSSSSDSSSAPAAPTPTPPAAPTRPASSPIRHRSSAVSRASSSTGPRPSVLGHLPLEYVTHLELFAEDPTPTAPAIERLDRARVRFRVGKGVDLWVAPPTFHPLLPPVPERDLLLNNRLRICRVDDPSRYEPD